MEITTIKEWTRYHGHEEWQHELKAANPSNFTCHVKDTNQEEQDGLPYLTWRVVREVETRIKICHRNISTTHKQLLCTDLGIHRRSKDSLDAELEAAQRLS
jgi:hypothetical protein